MKIGLEFEFALTDKEGNASIYSRTEKLYEAFGARGWQVKKDVFTGKIIGASKDFPDGHYDIGVDYGLCTFEIALPPVESVEEAQKQWDVFLHEEILPVLESQNLLILAYAHQPKTKDLRECVGPKGHYLIWNRMMDTMLGKEKAEELRTSITGVNAVQYNIDVEYDRLIPAVNVLTKLTYVIWSWSLSSPVTGGEVQPYLSRRLKDLMILADGDLIEHGRWYRTPLKEYTSMQEYVTRRWKSKIFEIIRDGESWYQPNHDISTWDFIQQKKAVFQNLKGQEKEIEINVSDLNFSVYFYWSIVRLHFNFDESKSVDEVVQLIKQNNVREALSDHGDKTYIEIRHVGMCPQNEIFSWLVFFIGCLNSLGELENLTKDWEMARLYDVFDDMLKYGLRAKWMDREFAKWGEEILRISKGGLKNYDKNLFDLLQPLERHLQTKASSAHDIIKVFEYGGMESLIDCLKVR